MQCQTLEWSHGRDRKERKVPDVYNMRGSVASPLFAITLRFRSRESHSSASPLLADGSQMRWISPVAAKLSEILYPARLALLAMPAMLGEPISSRY